MVENWKCWRTPANFQICNTRKRPHAVSAFAAGSLEDFRELASSKVLFCVPRTGGRPKHHHGICEWHNWCRKCGLLCSRMHPGRDRFWGSSKTSWESFWFQWAETCTFSALAKDTLVCAGCFRGGACPDCHLEWGVRRHSKRPDTREKVGLLQLSVWKPLCFFHFPSVMPERSQFSPMWRMLELSPLYPCV